MDDLESYFDSSPAQFRPRSIIPVPARSGFDRACNQMEARTGNQKLAELMFDAGKFYFQYNSQITGITSFKDVLAVCDYPQTFYQQITECFKQQGADHLSRLFQEDSEVQAILSMRKDPNVLPVHVQKCTPTDTVPEYIRLSQIDSQKTEGDNELKISSFHTTNSEESNYQGSAEDHLKSAEPSSAQPDQKIGTKVRSTKAANKRSRSEPRWSQTSGETDHAQSINESNTSDGRPLRSVKSQAYTVAKEKTAQLIESFIQQSPCSENTVLQEFQDKTENTDILARNGDKVTQRAIRKRILGGQKVDAITYATLKDAYTRFENYLVLDREKQLQKENADSTEAQLVKTGTSQETNGNQNRNSENILMKSAMNTQEVDELKISTDTNQDNQIINTTAFESAYGSLINQSAGQLPDTTESALQEPVTQISSGLTEEPKENNVNPQEDQTSPQIPSQINTQLSAQPGNQQAKQIQPSVFGMPQGAQTPPQIPSHINTQLLAQLGNQQAKQIQPSVFGMPQGAQTPPQIPSHINTQLSAQLGNQQAKQIQPSVFGMPQGAQTPPQIPSHINTQLSAQLGNQQAKQIQPSVFGMPQGAQTPPQIPSHINTQLSAQLGNQQAKQIQPSVFGMPQGAQTPPQIPSHINTQLSAQLGNQQAKQIQPSVFGMPQGAQTPPQIPSHINTQLSAQLGNQQAKQIQPSVFGMPQGAQTPPQIPSHINTQLSAQLGNQQAKQIQPSVFGMPQGAQTPPQIPSHINTQLSAQLGNQQAKQIQPSVFGMPQGAQTPPQIPSHINTQLSAQLGNQQAKQIQPSVFGMPQGAQTPPQIPSHINTQLSAQLGNQQAKQIQPSVFGMPQGAQTPPQIPSHINTQLSAQLGNQQAKQIQPSVFGMPQGAQTPPQIPSHINTQLLAQLGNQQAKQIQASVFGMPQGAQTPPQIPSHINTQLSAQLGNQQTKQIQPSVFGIPPGTETPPEFSHHGDGQAHQQVDPSLFVMNQDTIAPPQLDNEQKTWPIKYIDEGTNESFSEPQTQIPAMQPDNFDAISILQPATPPAKIEAEPTDFYNGNTADDDLSDLAFLDSLINRTKILDVDTISVVQGVYTVPEHEYREGMTSIIEDEEEPTMNGSTGNTDEHRYDPAALKDGHTLPTDSRLTALEGWKDQSQPAASEQTEQNKVESRKVSIKTEAATPEHASAIDARVINYSQNQPNNGMLSTASAKKSRKRTPNKVVRTSTTSSGQPTSGAGFNQQQTTDTSAQNSQVMGNTNAQIQYNQSMSQPPRRTQTQSIYSVMNQSATPPNQSLSQLSNVSADKSVTLNQQSIPSGQYVKTSPNVPQNLTTYPTSSQRVQDPSVFSVFNHPATPPNQSQQLIATLDQNASSSSNAVQLASDQYAQLIENQVRKAQQPSIFSVMNQSATPPNEKVFEANNQSMTAQNQKASDQYAQLISNQQRFAQDPSIFSVMDRSITPPNERISDDIRQSTTAPNQNISAINNDIGLTAEQYAQQLMSNKQRFAQDPSIFSVMNRSVTPPNERVSDDTRQPTTAQNQKTSNQYAQLISHQQRFAQDPSIFSVMNRSVTPPNERVSDDTRQPTTAPNQNIPTINDVAGLTPAQQAQLMSNQQRFAQDPSIFSVMNRSVTPPNERVPDDTRQSTTAPNQNIRTLNNVAGLTPAQQAQLMSNQQRFAQDPSIFSVMNRSVTPPNERVPDDTRQSTTAPNQNIPTLNNFAGLTPTQQVQLMSNQQRFAQDPSIFSVMNRSVTPPNERVSDGTRQSTTAQNQNIPAINDDVRLTAEQYAQQLMSNKQRFAQDPSIFSVMNRSVTPPNERISDGTRQSTTAPNQNIPTLNNVAGLTPAQQAQLMSNQQRFAQDPSIFSVMNRSVTPPNERVSDDTRQSTTAQNQNIPAINDDVGLTAEQYAQQLMSNKQRFAQDPSIFSVMNRSVTPPNERVSDGTRQSTTTPNQNIPVINDDVGLTAEQYAQQLMSNKQRFAQDPSIFSVMNRSVTPPNERVSDGTRQSTTTPNQNIPVINDDVGLTAEQYAQQLMSNKQRFAQDPSIFSVMNRSVTPPNERISDGTRQSTTAPNQNIPTLNNVAGLTPAQQAQLMSNQQRFAQDPSIFSVMNRSVTPPNERVSDDTRQSISAPNQNIPTINNVAGFTPAQQAQLMSNQQKFAQDPSIFSVMNRSVTPPNERISDDTRQSTTAPNQNIPAINNAAGLTPDQYAQLMGNKQRMAQDPSVFSVMNRPVTPPNEKISEASRQPVADLDHNNYSANNAATMSSNQHAQLIGNQIHTVQDQSLFSSPNADSKVSSSEQKQSSQNVKSAGELVAGNNFQPVTTSHSTDGNNVPILSARDILSDNQVGRPLPPSQLNEGSHTYPKQEIQQKGVTKVAKSMSDYDVGLSEMTPSQSLHDDLTPDDIQVPVNPQADSSVPEMRAATPQPYTHDSDTKGPSSIQESFESMKSAISDPNSELDQLPLD